MRAAELVSGPPQALEAAAQEREHLVEHRHRPLVRQRLARLPLEPTKLLAIEPEAGERALAMAAQR